jgi:protein-S-isoprenylcysteine O-methyltransferase Ste14
MPNESWQRLRRDGSWMWVVRFTLLGLLAVLVCDNGYLLRHREKCGKLIENRAFNLLVVALYNACCYLIAASPPAGGWASRPAWLEHRGVGIGFVALGVVLTSSGLVLAFASLVQRRVLGLQDVRAGLLRSGAYRHFRHPIYTAILWISLGLALATRNPDGLLMFPALLGVNITQAITEERYDIGVRFREQYKEYSQTTRLFGPIWLWSTISVTILLVAGLGWNGGMS